MWRNHEKIYQMAYGANLSATIMGNQQRSPEQGNVQRLERYARRTASDWLFEMVNYIKLLNKYINANEKGGDDVSRESIN